MKRKSTPPPPDRREQTRRGPHLTVTLRWRIERDYQELKQEVGLGHYYEGRGWRCFHHHATLCIAAYGFLVSEKETIPPSGPRSAALLPQPTLPDSYRPRGAPLRPERHIPNSIATMRRKAHRSYRCPLITLPMLRSGSGPTPKSQFVTQ